MEFTTGEPILPPKKVVHVRDPQPYRNLIKRLLNLPPKAKLPVTLNVDRITSTRSDSRRGGKYQASTGVDRFRRELQAVAREEFNLKVTVRVDYLENSESRALRVAGDKTTVYVNIVRALS